MRDTIERQDAIDALVENKEMINEVLDSLTLDYNTRMNQGQRRGQINEDIETIKALPSALPEQRWIPVSERLPERYGWYLCTLKDGRVNCYYWNKKGEWVDNGKKHFFDLYNIRSRYTGEEINPEQEGSVYWTDWVIAWMPLPEPYKEGNSDD